MIQIGVPFQLLEHPRRYLPIGAPASFASPGYRELTLRGFHVRFEIGGRIYEASSSNASGNDGLRPRGFAFARRVMPLAPAMALDQKILFAKTGDAVAISWRLLGKRIAPVKLTTTPIFSSAEPKSNSSRVRTPHPQSAADCEIDGALWAAYRRYDKSAVTKQLLRRYLTTLTAVACCIHGPAGRRPGIKGSAHGGPATGQLLQMKKIKIVIAVVLEIFLVFLTTRTKLN